MADNRSQRLSGPARAVVRRDGGGGARLVIPERPELELPYCCAADAESAARGFLITKGGGLLIVEAPGGGTLKEETVAQPAWLAALYTAA